MFPGYLAYITQNLYNQITWLELSMKHKRMYVCVYVRRAVLLMLRVCFSFNKYILGAYVTVIWKRL